LPVTEVFGRIEDELLARLQTGADLKGTLLLQTGFDQLQVDLVIAEEEDPFELTQPGKGGCRNPDGAGLAGGPEDADVLARVERRIGREG
jgi:hypothetical protein